MGQRVAFHMSFKCGKIVSTSSPTFWKWLSFQMDGVRIVEIRFHYSFVYLASSHSHIFSFLISSCRRVTSHWSWQWSSSISLFSWAAHCCCMVTNMNCISIATDWLIGSRCWFFCPFSELVYPEEGCSVLGFSFFCKFSGSSLHSDWG